MKIEIHDGVQRDLLDGYRFYESQEPGLGAYFIDSLFSDVDSLRLYAGIHPRHCGFHRMLSLRFPYAIYYLLDGEVLKVYAALACRAKPKLRLRVLERRR